MLEHLSDQKESHQEWDFAFVGMGAANGLLLQALEKRGALAGKRVAIFEPRELLTNDKTYCFWAEEGSEMVEDLGVGARVVLAGIPGLQRLPLRPIRHRSSLVRSHACRQTAGGLALGNSGAGRHSAPAWFGSHCHHRPNGD